MLLNLLRAKCTYFQFKYANQLTIDYIKAFMTKSFLSFLPLHAEKSLSVFGVRASRLEVISSLRLDCRKYIHSVKSALSIWHSDHKAAFYRQ